MIESPKGQELTDLITNLQKIDPEVSYEKKEVDKVYLGFILAPRVEND